MKEARRRTKLRVEALEDRTLLSGNVVAQLVPATGTLQITGDIGNNSIEIFTNPQTGGIRVQGNDFTSVNATSFVEFDPQQVVSISISMQSGQETVYLHNLDIRGNVTETASGGPNVFTASVVTANEIDYTNSGGAGDSVTLTNVQVGAMSLSTGAGQDSYFLSGISSGSTTINSGGGGDTINIRNSSNLGVLQITTGAGNNVVDVIGLSGAPIHVQSATINVGSGANQVDLSYDQFQNDANVSVAESGANPQKRVLMNQDTFVAGNLMLTVGDATPVYPSRVGLEGDTWQQGGASITVGAYAYKVALAGDTFTQGNLQLTVPTDFTTTNISGLSVAGNAWIHTGSDVFGNPGNAGTVNLSSTTVGQLLDLNVGNGGNLNVLGTAANPITATDAMITVGDSTGSVNLTWLQTSHDLLITAGTGDTNFSLNQLTVGHDMRFTAGNGNNTAILTNIQVMDDMFVAFGSGVNSVAAGNVHTLTGTIDGGSGGSNTYTDMGGNSGFAVHDFVGFP